MTDNDSPVAMFFELQRETIRETGEFFERAVELAAESGAGLPAERQQELLEETVELARESTHNSLDAVEAITGETQDGLGDLRETVDSTFDALLDGGTQGFETVETQSEELEAETTAHIEAQVDRLVGMTEELEGQLTEVAEQFVEQAEDGDIVAIDELDEFADRLGEQADRFADLEAQFETIDVTGPDEE